MRSNSGNKIFYICYTLLLLLLASCSGKQTLRGVFERHQSPYEKYAAKIKSAGLDQTALGQDWLQAGQKALQDSITITPPLKETGYFAAGQPRALGYLVAAQRGERIVVHLEVQAKEPMQVFVDLFEVPENAGGEARRVASADSVGASLGYEVEEDQQHVLRVQPELLRSGQYTLRIETEPTLAFPVQGKTSQHIASIWGDPRDGGARRHEGVDIFAARGTPALAATDGTVTRVNVTPRGGKVVWVSDMSRRQSLYYAHLDSQLVQVGQRVHPGDTLGLVGNTGNAITTSPHLHFGIYRYGRGATNPYPYLHTSPDEAPDVRIDPALVGNWVRVSASAANLRLAPSIKARSFGTLPRHTPLRVTGGVSDWYRVALPNGSEAYIASSVVEAAATPISYEKLAAATDLLDSADTRAAAKDSLAAGSQIAILGNYNGFRLVRDTGGVLGWID
ncbi:M23 family metallopeptidase [Pontibacter sp. E15-1]|uniref:M23 family metallopeptidase n=1 Tax=Pontibacter sp. E15-1 TaxID=2919918 RepID=UPI001F5039F7|nr:M23 family metallopeptidase [Pontibacter sp. E15-1]MCJ8164564.1 M23 family metallopeptidase [Pontibacter sp. E15-1]